MVMDGGDGGGDGGIGGIWFTTRYARSFLFLSFLFWQSVAPSSGAPAGWLGWLAL